MPPFQLAIGITLFACTLLSLTVVLLNKRSPDGKIQLPIHDHDDSEDAVLDGNGEAESEDPFNIIKPEDMLDGYPIGEDAFWAKVRDYHWIIYALILSHI